MNDEHFSLRLQMRNSNQQITPRGRVNYRDALCSLASKSLNQVKMSTGLPGYSPLSTAADLLSVQIVPVLGVAAVEM